MKLVDLSKVCIILCVHVLVGLAACRPTSVPIEINLPVDSLATAPAEMSAPAGTSTIAPSPTSEPLNTATMPVVTLPMTPTREMRACAPLPGYTQAGIIAAISNPFHPPERPGSDDPHQAVDLAVEQFGIAVTGEVVQTVLAGQVAGVIADRFPYGNAVMIETALDTLPLEWLDRLHAPAPAPTLGPHPSLTCPQVEKPVTWDEAGSRSLYLLYAHMLEPAEMALDEDVVCGQALGQIGQSGNALNPHLHIEARVGPSGARFTSMAHYSGGVTPEEMANYCIWRVSGVFQLVDPTRVLEWLP